jgi:hypothetical protein
VHRRIGAGSSKERLLETAPRHEAGDQDFLFLLAIDGAL